MTDKDFTPLSGEEVMGGLSGRHNKRAATLLFAIESRTAHLVVHSKHALDFFLTEKFVEKHNLAFLEALDRGRELPFSPTIQDLERYAFQWAPLVPKNPQLQAAVAHLVSQKYAFPFKSIPGIRAALGLDEETVQEAYQRQYHKALETIFAPQMTLSDRLRWRQAGLTRWLEELPPFWIAFALTLTSTVGIGILALPIALASLGPLIGVILLVILGLANVFTIAFMAEAATRTGSIRYGKAFLGRMVADYLGRRVASIFTIGLFIYCGLGVMAYYLGFSLTLEDVTHIPAGIWMGCIFLAGIYFVQRKSLDATVASALLVGAINISLLLILSLLAFKHSQSANLLYVHIPFLDGQPFEASILRLVFGVIMTAYLGHLSVSNCAQVVLRRDPGGRSLIWGTVAAQITALILYCIWVLAVNGAIAPQVLAAELGTSLIPLAATIGPIIKVFGTIFVLLALGMASIHPSLVLFNLTHEWLPGKPKMMLNLARRRGQLLFHTRRGIIGSETDLRLGLTYLGLTGGQPQFRWDIQLGSRTHHIEICITNYWNITDLLEQLPELNQYDLHLALEVREFSPESVRLLINSSLRLVYRKDWDTFGLSMAEIPTLPDDQRQIVNWLMRQKGSGTAVSFSEIATYTGKDDAVTHAILNSLVSQNFLQELNISGKKHYQIRLAHRKKGRHTSTEFSQMLDKKIGKSSLEQSGPPTGVRALIHRVTEVMFGERGRAIISVSPLVLVFLMAEWLLVSGMGSFTALLNIRGILITPLLSGIFPIILVRAGRRKGEFMPAMVSRLLSHPAIMVILYVFFLSSLFFYGLIIWEAPPKRIAALTVGILVIGLTIVIKRQRGFASRMVVELCNDQRESGQTIFNIMAGGKPMSAKIDLEYNNSEQQIQAASGTIPDITALRCAHVHLPAMQVQELKVWVHTITPEGDSKSLPALLTVSCEHEKKEYDLRLFGGHIILPVTAEACCLELRLMV